MKTIRLPVLVLAVAAAGCGRPPPVAVPGTPPTATPPTAATTPPTARTLPGMSSQPVPPAVTTGDVPAVLREVFAERNQLHDRVDGALLTIGVWRWDDPDPRGDHYMRVDWQIEYTGPVIPFRVLKPDLAHWPERGRTILHVWHQDAGGEVGSFVARGGVTMGIDPPRARPLFAHSSDGRPVGGSTYEIMRDQFIGRVFLSNAVQPSSMWAQLEHVTDDRGDKLADTPTSAAWEPDAWTGRLWSPVVPVVVKPISGRRK